MRYDVFISYSSHDQKVVEGLCAYLEERRIRCFVAYRDIPKSVVWAKAIVEALDESRMMVVVFSDNFNNSDQVDREIELASEDKKPILTFRITDDAFKGAKKYYLKNINWIDAFPNPSEVFGAVADNIGKLLGIDIENHAPTPAPAPAPTPTPTPTPTPAKTYKVGDYYDDGKKRGVVFEVTADGQHGKIVSLGQLDLPWCSDKDEKRVRIGAKDRYNGAHNMQVIKSRDRWREKYPAFAWCDSLGEGWYLPAIEELKTLLLNNSVHNAVNKTLKLKYGIKLFRKYSWTFKDYWSSTESEEKEHYAWSVYMYIGFTYYYDKNLSIYARAVSAF